MTRSAKLKFPLTPVEPEDTPEKALMRTAFGRNGSKPLEQARRYALWSGYTVNQLNDLEDVLGTVGLLKVFVEMSKRRPPPATSPDVPPARP